MPAVRQHLQAYKPLKAKWDKEAPGKVKFVTKDFPLDPECNSLGGGHQAAGGTQPLVAGEQQADLLHQLVN